MSDDPEIRDIHDYIRMRIEQSDIDSETDQATLHNLIQKACSDYIVGANHDLVNDYEYHYIMAVRIADQIYASHRMYLTQIEEILSSSGEIPVPDETMEDYAERSARYVIGNTMTLIYSMAYEFVDDLLGELITDQIRDEIPKAGKNAIRSQVGSYRGKSNTLVACDVLDSDQREVIEHIGEVRRSLVHDVEERFTLSILEDLNEVNLIPHLLNDLYEMVYEEPALHYYDDMTPEDLIDS